MKVTPKYVEANGLAFVWQFKKKWTITCGNCGWVWTERIPLNDPSMARCPDCGARNVWSLELFLRRFEKIVRG